MTTETTADERWATVMSNMTPRELEAWGLAMTDRSYSSIGQQMGIGKREVGRLIRAANAKVLSHIRRRMSA